MDPQNNTVQTSNSSFPKILISGFFVLFAVFLLGLIFRKSRSLVPAGSMVSEVKNMPTVIPTAFPKEGSIMLKITDGITKKSLSSVFTVDVFADSNKSDIAGYDLLLGFDKNSLELIEAKSVAADFKVYKLAATDHVTITGTKQLSSKSPSVWVNTKIAVLTFRAKIKGAANMTLFAQKGKEVTELVDTKSLRLHPTTNSISVEIN